MVIQIEAAQVERRLFTSDEYQRMADVGILGEYDRVELIEGEILLMSPIGRLHQACVDRLTMALTPKVATRAILRGQGPILLSERSQVQPDIALLKLREDFYASEYPTPSDVVLLIEVSDKTLVPDRRVKMPLYAREGITEVWIVNLQEGIVEVYSQPSEKGYKTVRQSRRGESIMVPGFPEITLQVNDILG